jgi:endonuclease/exonuclease/phosphatase (EEP) superfamily protein YafD
MRVRLRRALTQLTAAWLFATLGLWAAALAAPRAGSFFHFVEFVPPLPGVTLSLLLLLAALFFRHWPALAAACACGFVFAGPIGGGTVRRSLPAGPTDVKVVTFNVAKWILDFEGVLKALEHAAPDVFCLEEAGIYEWDDRARQKDVELRARMADYRLVREGELLIGSRLPVVQHRALELPTAPPSRPLLTVALRLHDGGELTVMAAHLIFTRAFPVTPRGMLRAAEARRQQALAIRGYAEALGTRVVLCGDLNASPASAAIAELRKYFDDAFLERGIGLGMSSEGGLFARRIDYVMVHGVSVRSAKLLPPGGSDHLPLEVVLGSAGH